MITTRHTAVEVEFLHWLLLVILALAMILALATALAADPMDPPALPGYAAIPAGPLPRSFFPENPPFSERAATETAERLWMTFAHQQSGCYAEALAAWEEVRLPFETTLWREIGVAAALLEMDDLPQVLRRLETAERIGPHHPLVAYYRGLVWMRQAERLAQANGEQEPGAATLEVQRAVLQLMVIADLGEAIERADLVDGDEPLVVVPPLNGRQVAGPQVRDLLVALRAEHFVADAQRQLFRLHCDRREFPEAERHLDGAITAGFAGSLEMRQLADNLLEAGEATEAVRVMRQVVKRDHPAWDLWCGRIQNWLTTSRPADWLW